MASISSLKINEERILGVVCALYMVLFCFSVALHVYAIVMYRVPLPSFDVVDYHQFLAAAAEGVMRWDDLWLRHNGVHLLVLPKLVWALDMWLGHGFGWITVGVSALAISFTVILMAKVIYVIPEFSLYEKKSFSLLFALVFSSDILLNSTVNPIDIQWSILTLGLVLQAAGLQLFFLGRAGWKKLLFCVAGSLMAYLSSGPIGLMATSLLLTAISVGKYRRILGVKLFKSFIFIFLLLIIWEIIAWFFHWNLLLVFFASQFLPALNSPDNWQSALSYLYLNPGYYGEFFHSVVEFVAKFLCVPLGQGLAPSWLLISFFLLWSVLVFRSFFSWRVDCFWIIYLFIFSLLLGVAAAVFRLGGGYDFRHANMGFLLLFSSLILIYQGFESELRKIFLSIFLLVYGMCIIYVAWVESGEWAAWGRESLRRLQIGSAIGVEAPEKFGYVWKFDRDNPDLAEIRYSKNTFRRLGVGVYGTDGYMVFAGRAPLPATEAPCLYSLMQIQKVDSDPRAYFVQGKSQTTNGEEINSVVFTSDSGRILGYGLAEMPSHSLWDQVKSEWHWGGYLLLDDKSMSSIRVVAYDDTRRCQPWLVSLSDVR